jgi:cephalosporin hydroxylase
MYAPTKAKTFLYNMARLLWGGVDEKFHLLYYAGRHETWDTTGWLGTRVQKCPLDLWIYQEIVHEVRPDLIIETGSAEGGSAAFLAAVCDLIDNGQIATVDVRILENRPRHPRVSYLTGSSTDPEIIDQLTGLAEGTESVMVILDSDHSKRHVLQELQAYSRLVTPGSYLIV